MLFMLIWCHVWINEIIIPLFMFYIYKKKKNYGNLGCHVVGIRAMFFHQVLCVISLLCPLCTKCMLTMLVLYSLKCYLLYYLHPVFMYGCAWRNGCSQATQAFQGAQNAGTVEFCRL